MGDEAGREIRIKSGQSFESQAYRFELYSRGVGLNLTPFTNTFLPSQDPLLQVPTAWSEDLRSFLQLSLPFLALPASPGVLPVPIVLLSTQMILPVNSPLLLLPGLPFSSPLSYSLSSYQWSHRHVALSPSPLCLLGPSRPRAGDLSGLGGEWGGRWHWIAGEGFSKK